MVEEEYFDKTAGTEPKAAVEENEFKTHDSSSSPSASLSDTERIASSPSPLPDTEKVKVFNIFGREKKPVYQLLGGGKPADVLLWRKKKESASIVGGATAIWVFFELLGYNFLTFFCYFLMIALAVLFLWSNAHAFIHKTPPEVPKVHIQEEPFLQVSSALRIGINRAFGLLRDIASGKDLKKFLTFISGLWILSVVGSWCNFLTSFYIAVILLHTVPVLYEKYEKKVDAFAEKIVIWTRKKYAVFDEKVVSKIRRGPLKSGKKDKKGN